MSCVYIVFWGLDLFELLNVSVEHFRLITGVFVWAY